MDTRKILVTICTGTTCYILGGSNYLLLSKNLPPEIASQVEIIGATCLGYCKEPGKHDLPCLTINGEPYFGLTLDEAVKKIAEYCLNCNTKP